MTIIKPKSPYIYYKNNSALHIDGQNLSLSVQFQNKRTSKTNQF